MRIMASLIKSAAVPCSGVFTAVRSAKPRRLEFLLLMSEWDARVQTAFSPSGHGELHQVFVDEGANPFVFFEIGSDELFGFGGLDAEIL